MTEQNNSSNNDSFESNINNYYNNYSNDLPQTTTVDQSSNTSNIGYVNANDFFMINDNITNDNAMNDDIFPAHTSVTSINDVSVSDNYQQFSSDDVSTSQFDPQYSEYTGQNLSHQSNVPP